MKKLNLEEAVKVLEDMKVKIAIPKAAELQRKRNEAIDMVIEALSSSEIPNSSDAVYRQAVLDICENAIDLWNGQLGSGALIAVKDKIEQLPSAEPERKTGRWISLDDFRGKYNEYGYKCSECGEHCDYKENYCPNCGAHMMEVKAEHDVG